MRWRLLGLFLQTLLFGLGGKRSYKIFKKFRGSTDLHLHWWRVAFIAWWYVCGLGIALHERHKGGS